MAKKQIQIRDFDLFVEVVKAAVKIVDSAKFIIGENGLEIYGARARIARAEMVSNAVYSPETVTFAVENLQTFLKVLTTVKDIHAGDYANFKFTVDLPHVRFESKKFKTKYGTQNEGIISKWVSEKVTTTLTPTFEFTTTTDIIRQVNSHSYIFTDPTTMRVYLETKADMENNALYATIGNRESDLNNEMTFKFGLITLGSIADRTLAIDLERMNLFNAIPSSEIKISLMDRPCLVSRTRLEGKNDSYFSLSIYNTLLKS